MVRIQVRPTVTRRASADAYVLGAAREKLWIRAGFSDSFLAETDSASAISRENFIRSYPERDIPQLGPRGAAPPGMGTAQ